MAEPLKQYIAIDLKSFYASVECVDRGLDPLTTNLVVADKRRTEKTICLAVSPSLKQYGIGGRARLFEVTQKLNEVYQKTGKKVDYIIASPRMARYMEVSAQIYRIYLHYIDQQDIHVYSCDEVFIEVTHYLASYKMSAHELAIKIIRHVLAETGITATAGIGTNLYLCKVAMDIVAKHLPADKDGVRIAELTEKSYRQQLWSYQPITQFWRVGRGIAQRLSQYGILTMGDLARASLTHEDLLYKLFGVNAELLIDHAWGWESCTMRDIKKYKPATHSLSSGQVLSVPYPHDKARIVVEEMADALSLKLVEHQLITNQLSLYVSYASENLTNPNIKPYYNGAIVYDHYGRLMPKPVHKAITLKESTSSSRQLTTSILQLYDQITNPILQIRRLNIAFLNLVPEKKIELPQAKQLDLFVDQESIEKKKLEEEKKRDKERRVQETLIQIKKQFGKNAILRGVSFAEGATAKERNQQIGGHHA